MLTGTIFGFRVHALRKSRKEPQRVLAELLDVSTNQICEIEKGRKTTKLENVARLCRHYNVSADYLLGLIDEPRPLAPGAADSRPPFGHPGESD